MIKDYHLTNEEIVILEKIARRSKMDCWFGINDKGQCVDYENSSKVRSASKMIKSLISGASKYDLECLSDNEKDRLIYLLSRI